VVLPDGSYLSRASGLEALLGAHPDGLPVPAPTAGLRAAAARAAELLRRHRLPLRVAWRDGRVALTEDEDPGDRAT
jgi:hypothetical protein